MKRKSVMFQSIREDIAEWRNRRTNEVRGNQELARPFREIKAFGKRHPRLGTFEGLTIRRR